MSYYTPTPSAERTSMEVKSHAEKYHVAKSKAIDPMHTFLLGMVKDECENHISDESTNPHALSGSKRNEFFRHMKALNVPYDIERLPSNMKEKSSLSGFTAEQMKNFAIVYARACLKGLIPDTSYRVLCLLCNNYSDHNLPTNSH